MNPDETNPVETTSNDVDAYIEAGADAKTAFTSVQLQYLREIRDELRILTEVLANDERVNWDDDSRWTLTDDGDQP